MLVQVRTDRHIQGHARFVERLQATISSALSRYSPQLTRVEVRLTDENGEKAIGDDKRCVLEARLSGLKPYAVTYHAPSLHQAINGAIDRLIGRLERHLGRLRHKKGSISLGQLPT